MSKPIRRWATAALATVAGAAVLTPLGGVAHAVTGTQAHFYVASKSGAPAALYNTATGARLSSPSAEVKDLRASQDGSRLIDLEASIDGNGNQVQTIRVYDVSGNALSVVGTVPSSVGEMRSPALSPDGSVAVWTRHDTGAPARLFSRVLATGVTSLIGEGLYSPVFASDTSLIVRHFDGTGYWMPLSGGTPTAITPFPWEAVGMTVSPDGTKIAWEHELLTTPATANIAVASLSVNGTTGAVTIGSPSFPATGKDNYAPAFTRDGTHVLFIKADNETIGYGQVLSVPTNGSSAPVVVDATAAVKVVTQAVGEVPPAPVSPLLLPARLSSVLQGTAATVRWINPADDRVSQILVRRSLVTTSGLTFQHQQFVPVPMTSFRDTGLTIGKAYSYTYSPVDRAGHVGTATAPWRLVAAGSAPTAADPTSATTSHAPFAVRFGPGTPNVTWTVDYRINSGTTWTRWVTNVAGMSRVFGSGATTGVAATTSQLGRTYQFRAVAKDHYGNSTSLIGGLRTVVPFDQTQMTISGGTTVGSTSAWLGSYRRLSAFSQYARATLNGNRLQVIAWRCASCGSFAVYDGATKIATVSTYSTSTKTRAVVFTKTYAGNATHVITIRALGTAGHPNVLLDGIAIRH
ncbi:MAG TPA: hypothetical protein VMZ11_02455 [Mycobacteriales bacterium]|nr:hypothetical protein [Mycobacteriales bacterium]